MKTRLALLAALILLVPPSAAAAAETLDTTVSVLIGFPADDAASSRGVLVVPGTVIPLTPKPAPRAVGAVEREKQMSERLVGVADSLAETLRLAKVEVSYSQPLVLELDVGRELPPPVASSEVRLHLKLLGWNDRSASYQVQFYERSNLIADTPVTVVRGERAIIGGRDGEAAPYLFLVVEPRSPRPALESPDGPLPEGDLRPPRIVDKVLPIYTEAARKKRIQGPVIVRTIIAEDGSVTDVEALQELPEGLTESAIEAVKQFRFEPATLDGKPIAVYYNLTINFRLAKDKPEETGASQR